MKTITLRAILLPILLGMAVFLAACNQKSPYEREVECRRTCGEQGKFGTLERRPSPPSPKPPLPIEYECRCS